MQGVLGICDLNCWIKKEIPNQVQFPGYSMFIFVLKFITMGAVLILTIIIIRYLLKISKQDKDFQKEVKSIGWKMLLFPLILLLSGLLPSIYSLLFKIEISSSRIFGIVTLFFGAIQGLLYPICYLVNSGISNLCSQKEDRTMSISDEDNMELFTDKDEEDNNIN